MLPAIAVFCFVHPAKYLGNNGGLVKQPRIEEGETELVEGNHGRGSRRNHHRRH